MIAPRGSDVELAKLDIVDVDLLRPPDSDDVRNVIRDEAAGLVDDYLRRLANAQARCRLRLGLIAARLLDTRAYNNLGFARLGDYSGERLGLAARSVQDIVRTTKALRQLRATEEAFERGELTWTHIRLLARVATTQTESYWLDKAKNCTVRDLEAAVKAVQAEVDAAQAPAETAQAEVDAVQAPAETAQAEVDAAQAPAETVQAEVDAAQAEVYAAQPEIRRRVPRSPASKRALNGDGRSGPGSEGSATFGGDGRGSGHSGTVAAEFGELGGGDHSTGLGPAAGSHASGAIDDEDLTVDGETRAQFHMPCPLRVRRLWEEAAEYASRMAGSRLCNWQAAESIAAEAWAGPPQTDHDGLRAWLAPAGQPSDAFAGRLSKPVPDYAEDIVPSSIEDLDAEASGVGEYYRGNDRGFSWLSRCGIREFLPDAIANVAEGLEACDPFELDNRARLVCAACQRVDYQMGCLLRTFFDLRLHRELGFSSTSAYARGRLGISASKARELVAIERKGWSSTREFVEAYRDGDISPRQASVLLRVISPRYGSQWIERAKQVTVRRLCDEVRWALYQNDEQGDRYYQPPPPAGIDLNIGCAVSDLLLEQLRRQLCEPSAQAAQSVQSAQAAEPAEVAQSEHFAQAVQAAWLGQTAQFGKDVQPVQSAQCDRACSADRGFVCESRTSGFERQMRAPYDGAFSGCLTRADLGARDRISFRGPASVVALLESAVSAYCAPREAAWKGMERLLLGVMLQWKSQPKHRDPVFERDGWRCTVPCCSSRRNLHDHHLKFVSRGGSNSRDNRTPVCAWHHLHGIHENIIRATGAAPHAIDWELGLNAHGVALMKLHGETYVAHAQ